MRDTSPEGHTSLSRTATCATGLSTENSISTAGCPTMSTSVTRAGVSKVIESASSRRWSPGNSGPSQMMQYSPPSAPVVCFEQMESGVSAPAVGPMPPAFSHHFFTSTWPKPQKLSPIQRPSIFVGNEPGFHGSIT